ncbi:MAG: hypothetical protein QXS93_03695 [Candidatus Micrarchaeia archaeon]
MANQKRITQKAEQNNTKAGDFKVKGPIIETSFNSYCQQLAEHFKGKGDLFEIKRLTRSALQNGISAEEAVSMIMRSADSRQYWRLIQRKIDRKIKNAELPLKFTEFEIEFIKKVLCLSHKSIEPLSNGRASPAVLRKAYCALLELEPIVVGRYLSQTAFDTALSEICDYFGLDGNPPINLASITKDAMYSDMRLLLSVKKEITE